ncbi:MAG: nitrate reductase cytochrome c-type subunit [Gloeobacteraceae cyanobacterium ES-bin-144]|nr:nitrate reductase cytochrome c-type subunit [Verrucomicrobiales bacterium]
MDSHDIETYFRQHRKTLAVVFLIVSMLAVSGFFMGMRQTERQVIRHDLKDYGNHEVASASASLEIPIAPAYKEIATIKWLANSDLNFTLADLPHAVTLPVGEVTATAAERAAAVERRSSLRAYDGAPPVIPHTIDTLSASSCMSCHGPGETLVIGGKRPAEMSHPWITNCTSCHVPADGMRQLIAPRETRLVVENSFIGKTSVGSGPRAYRTAPPTTPHPVWMRQNCMACHGPGREQAIRTSHPERQNCLQCHAPNAAFDNRETYLTNPKPPLDSLILKKQ